ncbi:MAG: catalase family peroxidase [Rhodanobacter sp.]
MKAYRTLTLRLLPLVAALVTASAFGQVSAPQAPLKYTPSQVVDSLHSVFGDHHARAIHAKGIMLTGTFTPAAAAVRVSSAPHLQHATVPVIVRFSNFAGIPDIADNNPLASPRGMAIRFALPNGQSTDLVAHSFNGFPSPNTDDFRDLMQAIAASGPTAAKPTKLDGYLAQHPVAKHFLTTQGPNPASYGAIRYFGVNTFKFINAAGKVTYGRYQIVPLARAPYLTDAQSKAVAPNYLSTEIEQRVGKEPIRFKLMLQIASKTDHLDDPSIAWPDSRKTVELGTLAINRLVPDTKATEKKIVFMPNSLPKGIEVEDPMINFRSAAYGVSFGHRR